MADDNYNRYRGRCRELSEAAVAADPSLTLVRGWYVCPVWGKEGHWWTVKPDGTIHDPSKLQYPSAGTGQYIPFNGMFECEQCGKEVSEDDALVDGHHVFCGSRCYARCIGVPSDYLG